MFSLKGGTVDVTTVKINDDYSMEHVHRAGGGPWGGRRIDDSFFDMIRALIGFDVMDEFSSMHPLKNFEMRQHFEQEKQKVGINLTLFIL